MRNLRFLLLVACALAGPSILAAQEMGPRGGGRGNQMGMMMQGITLSAEQQIKVDTIASKYTALRASLMQDQSLDQPARRAKGQELMAKQMDELKAVLTDEQKAVLEKNVAEMQARMQGGGRPPR
jgi:Spy/CpxP family protein refolding chaperone